MYTIHSVVDAEQWPVWANVGVRSNTYAYQMRLSIWSKINSKTSHRLVAEVAVSREAIMEEEETEEGVGQEALVGEEGAEVERVKYAPI